MSLSRALYLSRRTLPAFASEGVFWGAFAAFAPQIKEQIGADDGAFGVALLFGAVGAVSAMWLAPRFSRQFGRYAIPLAAILLALTFQGPVWMTAIWPFAMLMIFAGASSGLLDVVMNARLSQIESEHRVSLMNLNHAAFSFAYAISAICAGLAREQAVSVTTVTLLLMVVVCIGAVFMVPRSAAEQPPERAVLSDARLPVAVILGGVIVLIAFFAENATEGWSALHVERTLGGGAAEGALGPAMLGLTMGIGRLAGQFVVGRVSEARVVFWGALMTAAGSLAAALAASPMLAYIGFAFLGLGVSIIAPMVFALVGRGVTDDIRAKAISRVAVIGYCGFFIGPPAMGFVAQFAGLRWSFAFVALLLGLIPVLLILLRRSEKQV